MKKSFLITTGGSGGHVIPALILYEHLSKEANVIITTDKRGLKYLDDELHKCKIINTPRLDNILLLPFNMIKIIILTLKSLFLLKNKKYLPVLIFGFCHFSRFVRFLVVLTFSFFRFLGPGTMLIASGPEFCEERRICYVRSSYLDHVQEEIFFQKIALRHYELARALLIYCRMESNIKNNYPSVTLTRFFIQN